VSSSGAAGGGGGDSCSADVSAQLARTAVPLLPLRYHLEAYGPDGEEASGGLSPACVLGCALTRLCMCCLPMQPFSAHSVSTRLSVMAAH
jgi:hypothetical protein